MLTDWLVRIIFPPNLRTIIIALMLSIGEERAVGVGLHARRLLVHWWFRVSVMLQSAVTQ